ncbi:MAG: hypothetical protein A2020_02045 [Lentisphaerae bacterium GWF2_45_14]|nr:MAG: hypothetical protein A2020_02045 [Lentisphaerae bacterium GWF2_45_14]
MKLSTKSRYGLRILIQIAVDSEIMPAVKGKVVAQQQNISEAYLEQIMIPLKNSGMVGTVRGCNGGYVLNKKTEDINLLEIIEIFEGKVQLVRCVGKKNECKRSEACTASTVWWHLSEVIRKEASLIKLSELVEKEKKINKMDYVI